ncbi:MAG: phosphoenolpyruvate--protein phosphotransferase [Alphaproteobacteria bacterium]|jgi:phosphotransferase system enzyme I (PtsP)|nr:phosphoenolpyruvate--protein phosphotransferase [Alphaproteobacteria bacterium]
MKRPAAAGPRLLLKRLRELLAGPGSPDDRLHEVVRVIASNMVSEVCSVYLMRPGEILELYATEGLNPSAVHRTRLNVGEGLVGDIAMNSRPLALADAQSHPHFAYRPETGEEIYHSLLGVPILRAGKSIGVLVVQNRTRRQYAEEEVEVLETIAMVLAELVSQSGILAPEDLARVRRSSLLPTRIEGRALSEGLAIGTAHLHEPRIEVTRTVAEDTGHELERLERAILSMRDSIDLMLDGDGITGESRDILETYKMFAYDKGWNAKLHEAVESGLTAEAAVQRVQTDMRNRMNQITDPYIRERLADLEDLANRLLLHLSGRDPNEHVRKMPDNAVLFARSMGPAELLDYDRARLQALVLEEGSTMSHVAIVARALNLPVVGSAEGAIAAVELGDQVIVDADRGQLFIRPREDVQAAFRQNMAVRAARLAKYASQKDDPAVTRDGRKIRLYMNAGLLADLDHLDETGADGIGLYRTELHFMVRSSLPRIDAQAGIYASILDSAKGRPVVFRTLDIGGDKRLPYMPHPEEENPALGWRAIRMGLDRPVLLRSQLRALLIAGAGRRLDIMFPMVSEVEEFIRARAMLDSEVAWVRKHNREVPSELRVGTMLEVPALAYQLGALLPRVDFISIGSNDLMQFLFAVDRGNPKVMDRYDRLAPGFLKFLKDVVDQCRAAGRPVTLCGEMGGKPLEAMALIGIGLDGFSMQAGSVGPVKEMLRSLDAGQIQRFMAEILDSHEHSIRDRLLDWAASHGISVGA